MNHSTHQRILGAVAIAIALATVGTVGCTSTGTTTTTTAYTYDDGYIYTSYYPADVAYASYYWAYPWDYTTLYYLGSNAYGGGSNNTNNTNNTTGAAGATGTT